MPHKDDLHMVLIGEADEATELRVRRELEDPRSSYSRQLRNSRNRRFNKLSPDEVRVSPSARREESPFRRYKYGMAIAASLLVAIVSWKMYEETQDQHRRYTELSDDLSELRERLSESQVTVKTLGLRNEQLIDTNTEVMRQLAELMKQEPNVLPPKVETPASLYAAKAQEVLQAILDGPPIASDSLKKVTYSQRKDGLVFPSPLGAGGQGVGIRQYPEFELHYDDPVALDKAMRDFAPIRDFGDLRDVLKVVVNGDAPSKIVALETLYKLSHTFDAQEAGWIPLLIDAAHSDNFYVMKSALTMLTSEAPTDEVLEAIEPALNDWIANEKEGISRVTKVRKQVFLGAVRRTSKDAARRAKNAAEKE